MVIAPESTEYGRSSQPHPVGTTDYLIRMGKEASKTVLWANVASLMKAAYGKENLTQLAKDVGIGPGTASRIKAQETSVGIDVVDLIAEHFKVEAWQLLSPGFDSARPAVSVELWPFASSAPSEVATLPSEQIRQVDGYLRGVIDTTHALGKRDAA